MTKDLYIIGNGFDLYHGIKSSYSDFAFWLGGDKEGGITGNDEPLFEWINRVYCPKSKYLWSDFESSLCSINNIVAKLNAFGMPLVLESHPYSNKLIKILETSIPAISRCSNIYPELGINWRKLHSRITSNFENWILSLNIHNVGPLIPIKIQNSFFINFNYTRTLETLYGIPKEQIFHIHGCAGQDSLIFGHGKDKKAIDHSFEHSYDEEEEISIRGVIKFLKDTSKPIQKIIKSNKELWESLSCFNTIHFWGHSLGSIDIPYFIEIQSKLNLNAKCIFNWFVDKNKMPDEDRFLIEKHSQISQKANLLYNLGFRNISFINFDDLNK